MSEQRGPQSQGWIEFQSGYTITIENVKEQEIKMKQKKRKLTAELIFLLTLLTLLFTSSSSGAWSSNRRVYKEREK